MRFTVDSNVLIYAADKTAGHRHQAALHLLAQAARADALLMLQSLVEFYHAVTRKGRVPPHEAAKVIGRWLRIFRAHPADRVALEQAISITLRYRLQFWDAMMVSAADQAGCRFLLSEDLQDGQTIGRVTVINPFDAANAKLVGALLPPPH